MRNRIVLAGLEAAKKSSPAAFFTPETAQWLRRKILKTTWRGAAKWIGLLKPLPSLEIKRNLFSRIEAVRRPGTIVSSNTSGLPIKIIAEGRSEDFQQHRPGRIFLIRRAT